MKLSLRWRLTAAAALAALAGFAGLVIVTVLTKPVLLLLVAALMIGIVYSGWLIFTGSRQRLRFGWTLLIGCLIILVFGLVVFFIRGNDLHRLAAIVFLGIIYSLLVASLREQFWSARRAIAQQTRPTANFAHPVLIMNPKSGEGRAIKAGIDKKAKAQGIRVIVTKKGDSIEGLARRAVADGVDVLGVSGGDGTLGAVAKVALENNLPLVVLPGGTRCHFARDAGFEPERIVDALASFHGVERAVDVGLINGRVFLNNASFGLYADIVDHPGYREHKVATSRTVLRELLEGKRPPYDLRFRDGTGRQHRHAVQILVGVNPYESLKLFELGHRKSLNTGKLQITAVTKLDDATVRQLMSTITLKKFFTAKTPDNFLQWETASFRVTNQHRRLVAGVDGERETYATPVTVTLHPTKLRLMVPAEGMRPRTSLPLNAITLKRLWRAMLGQSIE